MKRFLITAGAIAGLTGAYLLGSLTLGTSLASGPFGSSETEQCQAEGKDDGSNAALGSAKVTPDQARAAALAQYPNAKVDKVELQDENGTATYGVQLTDSSGKGWDVKVHAGTGAIVGSEPGGPEASGTEAGCN